MQLFFNSLMPQRVNNCKEKEKKMKKKFQILIDILVAFGFRSIVTMLGKTFFQVNLESSQILWTITLILTILVAELYSGNSNE